LSHGPALVVPLAEMEGHTTPQLSQEDASAIAPVTAPVIALARWARRQPVRSILTDVDRDQIIRALKEANGRVGGPDGAASRLGLKRTTFITRMKKLGIDPNRVSKDDISTRDTSDTSDSSRLIPNTSHASPAD
jgi:formate hydrogenlyase transcriptional activator